MGMTIRKPQTLAELKKDIERIEKELEGTGRTLDDVNIVLSDDEELNGVHSSYRQGGLVKRSTLYEWLDKGMFGDIAIEHRPSEYFFLIS